MSNVRGRNFEDFRIENRPNTLKASKKFNALKIPKGMDKKSRSYSYYIDKEGNIHTSKTTKYSGSKYNYKKKTTRKNKEKPKTTKKLSYN